MMGTSINSFVGVKNSRHLPTMSQVMTYLIKEASAPDAIYRHQAAMKIIQLEMQLKYAQQQIAVLTQQQKTLVESIETIMTYQSLTASLTDSKR